MDSTKIKFFSLKPRNTTSDVKNYDTYKKALDFCFDEKNNINNIGVVGDYGTGKSTIINTYVANDLSKSKYDIISVSLLTLESDKCSSTDILKNIIKQIVHNPKKSLEYSILKFQPLKTTARTILAVLGFVLAFLFVFFANESLISSIPILNLTLSLNLVPEAYQVIKYFLLATILVFFLIYIYPKLLAGIRINKFKVASAFDAEIKRTTEELHNEELDYLEYLIYLLKRANKRHRSKNLLLIIEDIDRFENIQIFQQLREVNNLLNDAYSDDGCYKFIYAVGNSLFSSTRNSRDVIALKESHQSEFKDRVTKFFDFIINITPVMDNQNSYEFIKSNFPDLVSEGKIIDEDLFMISQYISSPRVLIDLVNDYQMMKDMRIKTEGFSDIKLLYYSILKSKFYNFYDIIHEVFYDLELIVKYYSNKDTYLDIEKKREEDFVSVCGLYALKNAGGRNYNYSTFATIWAKIKNEYDFAATRSKFGGEIVYHKEYGNGKVTLAAVLDYAKEAGYDYIFSNTSYTHKIGADLTYDIQDFTQLLSQYYQNNDVILEVIKSIENERNNDPNRPTFSIKEFLDIDYVKLGIKENLLDIKDYNVYISQNYLEPNDAKFIKQFNLFETDDSLYTMKLYDIGTVLSKMKLEKIDDENGLNVYIFVHFQATGLDNPKAYRLYKNAINSAIFVPILLSFDFEQSESKFKKTRFLLENANRIDSALSMHKILEWYDYELAEKRLTNEDLTSFLDKLSEKFDFTILDTSYHLPTYSLLIATTHIFKDEITLQFLLEKVRSHLCRVAQDDLCTESNPESTIEKANCKTLINTAFTNYRIPILEEDEFSNLDWLPDFNAGINFFVPLLDDGNINLIKHAYQDAQSVKVEEISILSGHALFTFIYEHNFYQYSSKNISYLSNDFDEGTISNYFPFIAYSLANLESLKNCITNNSVSKLDINKEWAKSLVYSALTEKTEADFKGLLDFFATENPLQIPDISELNLTYSKLIIFITYPSLYAHTLANLEHLYEQLSEAETPQVELLKKVLADDKFDFTQLFHDINSFDEDSELYKLIYRALFSNDGVSSEVFEKYIAEYNLILSDGQLLSSQRKVRIMCQYEKITLTIDNLLLCSATTLKYLYIEKGDFFSKAMSELSTTEALRVLQKFDNKDDELACLTSLFSSDYVGLRFICDLAEHYLNDLRSGDSKSDFEVGVIILLRSFKAQSQDVEKLLTLLESKKGQRTISSDLNGIVNTLCAKKILTCEVQPDNRLLLKYA